MLMLILLLACLAAEAQSFAIGDDNRLNCWTDGNGEKQARYWDNGSEVTRGRYFYKCVDGRLDALGCIKDDGSRVVKNEAYIEEGFEYKCVMDTEGYLYFEPSACVTTDGKRHQPGDTWDHVDNKEYWFMCSREYFYDRPYLSVTTQGCLVGVNKLRIKINETFDDPSTNSWYKCLDRYDSTQLCLMGCVYNGEHKKGGDQWKEGEYVYTCAKKSDRAIVECIGCMNGQRELRSGDRYLSEDQIFQCEILLDERTNEVSQKHKLVGCVERDRQGSVVGERVLGCHWSENDGDMRYERVCSQEGLPEPVGCVLMKDGVDYLFLPPNSYTIHHSVSGDTTYLACRLESDGKLNSFNFTEDELANGSSGRLRGLKYAPPRG